MTKSKITVINTGGTFNKRYNPLSGELEVPNDSLALDEIISYCYNIDFDVLNIISKDSLEMSDVDRELIVKTIKNCKVSPWHSSKSPNPVNPPLPTNIVCPSASTWAPPIHSSRPCGMVFRRF